jgi:hypothetical protein
VYGNGAEASHRAMHARRQDGHHYLTRSQWEETQKAAQAANEGKA